MRKHTFFLLFLFPMLLIISCQDEQKDFDTGIQMGRLTLSSSKPQPGQELRFKYKKPEDSSEIPEATVDYIVHKSYYPEDVELKDSADYLVGRIRIPDSAMAVAFNFMKDFRYENNDKKGYVTPLFSKEGKKLAGSEAAIGTYYITNGLSYDLQIERDSALAMIGRDLERHPEIREEYDDFYPQMLIKVDETAAKDYVNERLVGYEKKDSVSDLDYTLLHGLYVLSGKETKADSINAVALEKFPGGELAERSYYVRSREVKTPEEREQLLKDYEKNFGSKGRFYSTFVKLVAASHVSSNNFEKVLQLTAGMDKIQAASYLNSIAWQLAEKGENLQKAEELSSRSIELLKQSVEKPDHLSKKQFERTLSSNLASFYDTYGLIHYKLGNLEKALEAQEKAVTDHSSVEVNERYLKFLMESGQDKKAREIAEDFVKNNRSSEKIKEYLAKAYLETNNTSQPFEEHLASLEAEAYKQLKKTLQEEMIKESAPEFRMKDLEGNDVTLNSLKGKTVILDFWATWCGPCKMSFPGMQDAVTKYKDDTSVKFLFVDTFESGPDREKQVEEYIQESNYSFHVLLDPTKEGNGFQTADAYGIQGIPTKVIIDPQGNIRFKVVGYHGNNEKMIQELDIMIELITNPKNSEKSAT